MSERGLVQQFVINNIDYGDYNVTIENTLDGVKIRVMPGNIERLLYGYKSATEGTFKVTVHENNRESVMNLRVEQTGTEGLRIEYNVTSPTNGNVIARLVSRDPIEIINNGGKNFYVFDGSRETFTFEYKDIQGNVSTITAKVDWIDKDAPIGTVRYSNLATTSESVIATLETDKDVRVLNTIDGRRYHVFHDNGEFTFEFEDLAGNPGKARAKVNWIDKDAPEGVVSYSTTSLTNQKVIATVTTNEEVVHLNTTDGTHEFISNGAFMFEFEDLAGNKGKAEARVTWISLEKPKATISYSNTSPTNENVIATLVLDNPEDEILDGKTKDHLFSTNGVYTWRVKNKAGNVAEFKAEVTWIDKVPPVGTITYETLPNKNVKATLVVSEEVTILTPSDGNNEYTFVKDGSYSFRFRDIAGNIGTATAVVSTIDEEKIKDLPPVFFNETSNGDGTSKVEITFPYESHRRERFWIVSPTIPDGMLVTHNTNTSTNIGGYWSYLLNIEEGYLYSDVDGIGEGSLAYTIQGIDSHSKEATYRFSSSEGESFPVGEFSLWHNCFVNGIKIKEKAVSGNDMFVPITGRTVYRTITENKEISVRYRTAEGIWSREYKFTTSLAIPTQNIKLDKESLYIRPNFINASLDCPWENNKYYKLQDFNGFASRMTAYTGGSYRNKRRIHFEELRDNVSVHQGELPDNGIYDFSRYEEGSSDDHVMFYITGVAEDGLKLTEEQLEDILILINSYGDVRDSKLDNETDYGNVAINSASNSSFFTHRFIWFIREREFNSIVKPIECLFASSQERYENGLEELMKDYGPVEEGE